MYVNEVGIVYWTSVQDSEIVRGGRQEALAVADTMLIDSVTIPGTGFYRKNNQRNSDDSLESRIGEVKSHIVLEGWIVFTTDLNKVFCYPTLFPMPAFDIPEPIELTTFPSACPSSSFQIRDLQGSFIRFAIFTNSGSVLTADKDILIAFRDASTSSRIDENRSALPSPTLIPSLQSGNVICLAFGDHHFHALQANGTIVSYGLEPQRCGALGLGNTTVSPLRGVLTEGLGFGGGRLLNDQGRTVWFEPKMQDWLHDMESKSHNGEANARGELIRSSHPSACEAMGKYFEREGAKWEDTVTKDGEMGAYFALKVSAAGWHSAALVLVDEDKAEAARNAHIVHPAAPTAPPSPALSAQSINSVDTQGFSYEIIDSPGEQLAHAVYAIYDWVWQMGRWFLGLQGRDERKKGEHERGHDRELAGGKNGKESEGIEPVYTWSNDPFPRLRMEGGEVMPGEIEVME